MWSREKLDSEKLVDRMFHPTLMILLLSIILIKIRFIFVSNVNWDEFNYLSQIYEYGNGNGVNVPLVNSLHVHFFTWLIDVSGNELTQITVGRCIFFLLLILTLAGIYRISRVYVSPVSALFVVCCYAGVTNVAWHGASFRPDTLCAFLLVLSVGCLHVNQKYKSMACLSGVLAALALMFNLKTVLWFGVYCGILFYWLLAGKPVLHSLQRMFLVMIGFVLSFVLLYAFHASMLRVEEASETIGLQSRYLTDVATTVLLPQQLYPRLIWLIRSMFENPMIWLLVLCGVVQAILGMRSRDTRAMSIVFLGFFSPLISIGFYRNAFPYYYVFMLPMPMLLAGLLPEAIRARETFSPATKIFLFSMILIFVSLSYGRFVYSHWENSREAQSELVTQIHAMFPEPVTYIDRNDMITSFDKKGLFMSSWGLRTYRMTGKPIMREIIESDRPAFLLANRDSLDLADDKIEALCDQPRYLFCEDYKILQKNFAHFWGDIYLAGFSLKDSLYDNPIEIEVIVAGTYVLEAEGAVSVGDQVVQPAGEILLEKGFYRISNLQASDNAVLWFGKQFDRPDGLPSDQPLYVWR